MESLSTSPFNPFRKLLSKDYTLEQAKVVIRSMEVMRDLRYKPKRPFLMMQQAFKESGTAFAIKRVDAELRSIQVELSSTDFNTGQLQLNDIHATVNNITNRKNRTMHMKGLCPIDSGRAEIEMQMTMNEDCDFAARLHAEGVNASVLNTLIRPLVGMTCTLAIDTLDTRYSGNKSHAQGTFKMLYHGLGIRVHEEDNIPYKIVTRNAHAINVVGNSMIPKSNPATRHGKAKAYNVEWTRNEWKPTELYLFGPLIDGIKKTMLPGLYIMDRNKIIE